MDAGLRARGSGDERPQSGRLALSELLDVELEAIEGLEDVAAAEAGALPSNVIEPIARERAVILAVTSLDGLESLRCPVAAYLVVSRVGSKPTALVGDDGLADACSSVLGSHPDGTFTTFGLDMPGKDSPAAKRVREAIVERTGLRFEKDRGQLLVRVRRSKDGWQALVRLTPKPLSTRPWRTTSVAGAVNACIAASMVRLLEPRPSDAFLNLMCGSGTIAIERALMGDAQRIVALDVDPEMTRISADHAERAGVTGRVAVLTEDSTATSLDNASFDKVAAVLPYGFRVGSHDDNVSGYGAVLHEAARLATPGARFAVLTQELKLITEAIASQRAWAVDSTRRIWQGGYKPELCVLVRSAD